MKSITKVSLSQLSNARSVREKIIGAADKPLLSLALAAAGLCLLTGPVRDFFYILTAVFVTVFSLKLLLIRGRYPGSTWIATVLLSCLPELVLQVNMSWLQTKARQGGDPPSQVHMKWCEELTRSCVEAPNTALSVTE
jgi:hypothetical protein